MVHNDLSFWYPWLLTSGVPTPKTITIKTECDLRRILDGDEVAGFGQLKLDAEKACREVGFPAFLRTGHTSAKHDWDETCLIRCAEDIDSHIFNIVEHIELSTVMGLPYDTWAVREMLKTKAKFYAFNGTPIVQERRYFIEDGGVICHHPYWPLEAFTGYRKSCDDWEEKLAAMNVETEEEVEHLTRQSEIVSQHFQGAWSLDWLLTEDRGWVAIDMAKAEDSYHWTGCSANKKALA